MADTYTTALNLTKPEVGASADTWGTKLNTNFDTLDGLFDSGPYLAVDAGGTGAGTASGARTSLGLGTIATQAADNVAITGGTASVGLMTVNSTEPNVFFYCTVADSGERQWRLIGDSIGSFYLQAVDDSNTAWDTALYFTRDGGTVTGGNFGCAMYVDGNVIYHAGNVSSAAIAESQITDGAVLARVGGNEAITGTWSFSTVPTKASAGKFLHYASSGNNGGSVTVSTDNASGTPAAGDLWIKYVA